MFTSKLRAMWHDEDAVSPVIGVILMVAVTVVLAAVIGAFVFGMGSSLNQPAPSTQVEFTYNANTDTLSVSHAGGTTLNEENTGKLHVRMNSGTADVNTWAFSDATLNKELVFGNNNAITAGEQIVQLGDGADDGTGAATDFDSGESMDLVWQSPDGSSSQVLGSYTAD